MSEQIPPPSLKAVARELGAASHSLTFHHPVPCQAILERYAAYMTAKKLAPQQQHCQAVQDAVCQLMDQNIPPTGTNLAKLLPKPGILRSSVVREARRVAIGEWQRSHMENR